MVPVHNMKINIVNKIRDTYLCPPSPRAFAIFLFRDQLARLDEGMDTVVMVEPDTHQFLSRDQLLGRPGAAPSA